MGLFSSKTKVQVSSVQMNLLGTPPDLVKEAVLYAVLSNNSIPAGVMEAGLNGISGKVDKAYAYARDDYVLGLPNGVMSGVVQAPTATVKAILESILGQSVQIYYTFIAEMSPEMAAMEWLRQNRGFKFNTNTITNHSFVISNPNKEPLRLRNVEYLSGSHQLRPHYVHYYYETEFVLIGGGGSEWETTTVIKSQLFSETIPFPSGLQLGRQYCVAAYVLLNQQGNIIPGERYWYYRMDQGTYPQLNGPTNYFGTYSYLPIIPIRKDNQDLTREAVQSTDLYQTSKALLKRLSIDIDTVAALLNTNPDIDQIDHAYVMFGINIQTKKQESLAYLCDYFDYLADVSVFTRQDYLTQVVNNRITTEQSKPVVGLSEYGLNVELHYNYITSTFVAGSIGRVGLITSRTVAKERGTMIGGVYRDDSYIQFRQQITSKIYREITVHGLVHINKIYDYHSVELNLYNSLSATDDNDANALLIPVHYGIARNLPLMIRNKMYYDSCRLVINTYDEYKLKWYQSGIFKIVFFLAAIVIAVYTGQGWLVGLAAAAKAGAMAMLMYILPALLIGVAVNYGMKFVAEALGGQTALIIGMVAIVISLAVSPSGSFQMMGKTLPTSQSLLQAGSALTQAGNKAIIGDVLDVEKELALFETEAGKQWSALEDTKKLLDSNSGLAPIQLLSSVGSQRGFPVESPDAFYNRTIHTGNIGVLALDVIENYAEIMLKLPEVKYPS